MSTNNNNRHSIYTSEEAPSIPMGLRTPSRVGKRTRYDADVDPSSSLGGRYHSGQDRAPEHEQRQEGRGRGGQQGTSRVTVTGGSFASSMSIQRELDETRRLVKTFDAIDTSMTEARDKLKTFYKTADETNMLLDMWIRVLSQTEHTQKLLQDPAWEGYTMEEARYRENQERRAAYQQAMEEANNNHRRISSSNASAPSFSISSPGTLLSYSTAGQPNSQHHGSTTLPLRKSPSAALVAAAHAHASAIAASRKRNGPGAGAGGSSTVPKA